ncbi:MAG: pyridoxal-phosphate dependent enzyme [Lachnospiraceae bacterium]|nr:pyridoxal-phosphate dependent enzyme [Lachnospiraceae bacterium]
MQKGYFGKFGGRYVPEAVMNQLFSLECEVDLTESDRCFWDAYDHYMEAWAGGRTPLYLAENLSEQLGHKLYLKRGDANDAAFFGSAVGQLLLWKRIGYLKAVAETGCGLWGVAVARAAALMEMECVLYVTAEEETRQQAMIETMKLCGAKVITAGRDSVSEAITYWADHSRDTCMIMTGDWGPYPYTEAVASLQKLIGEEMKGQMEEQEGKLPGLLVAGARPENVLGGLFAPFFEENIQLYGAEPEGKGGVRETGIAGGMRTLAFQDGKGRISFTRSYHEPVPVLGPELASLMENGKICLETVSGQEAEAARALAARTEGICLSWYDACSLALAVKKGKQLDSQEYLTVFLNKGEDAQ